MILPIKIKIIKSHDGLPPVGTVMEISNISDKYYSYFPDVIDAKCEYVDRDMISLSLEAGYAEEVKDEMPQWRAWERKEGDMYFYLDVSFDVSSHIEDFDYVDDGHFKSGNYFISREIATQARDRILETLKQFHKEHKNDPII